MTSRASSKFWRAFERLPNDIKEKAREAHKLWMKDPRHASLQFKRIHVHHNNYSARIALNWRALCVKEGDTFIWFWIGTHADYDKILSRT